MSEDTPKSALELVMERLRKQDEAAGVVESAITAEQKAAIAEARNVCEAKLAEARILHQSKLVSTFDPAARAELEEGYRRDCERIRSDCERRIARIRAGDASGT